MWGLIGLAVFVILCRLIWTYFDNGYGGMNNQCTRGWGKYF